MWEKKYIYKIIHTYSDKCIDYLWKIINKTGESSCPEFRIGMTLVEMGGRAGFAAVFVQPAVCIELQGIPRGLWIRVAEISPPTCPPQPPAPGTAPPSWEPYVLLCNLLCCLVF